MRSHVTPNGPNYQNGLRVIFTLRASSVFGPENGLKAAISDAERAIVQVAREFVGGGVGRGSGQSDDDYSAIALALGTSPKKIGKALDLRSPNTTSTSLPKLSDDFVIFRITVAMAFSQHLKETIREMEREVFRAATLRFGSNRSKMLKSLRTGKGRSERFADLEQELQKAGWWRGDPPSAVIS